MLSDVLGYLNGNCDLFPFDTDATLLQLYPIRVCVPGQKCPARDSLLITMESFYPSPILIHV